MLRALKEVERFALKKHECNGVPLVHFLLDDARWVVRQVDVDASGEVEAFPRELALREVSDVRGCRVFVFEGVAGTLSDLVVDDETWAVRYFVVTTEQRGRVRQILIAPSWTERIDWRAQSVRLDLPRASLEASPEWDQSQPIDREYEFELHDYYLRIPYWLKMKPLESRVPMIRSTILRRETLSFVGKSR